MGKIEGKTILITGGAAGIGLCLALEVAAGGNNLIISDINQKALDAAVKQIKKETGAKVTAIQIDVSNKDEVDKLAADIEKKYGGLDILVNNAGIGASGEIADTEFDTWQKLFDVNFWGPLYHIYAFLPGMKARGEGQIVNVSSGQVFFRLPTWGAYTTTKLAIAGFSEVLGFELKKHGIDVTTVYPYMVNTGFYSDVEGETFGQKMSMKLLPYYSQTPEKVAHVIYKAIAKKKRVEMVHPLNDIASFARGAIPFFPSVVGRVSALLLAK